MNQQFTTALNTQGGWLAVQYHHSAALYWPVKTRVQVCEDKAGAYSVATGWAVDQGLAFMTEEQFGDLLMEEMA